MERRTTNPEPLAPSPQPLAPYILVLTHDVDILSMRGLPLLGRRQLSLLKTLLVTNYVRWRRGRIAGRDYLWSLWVAFLFPLTLLGLVPDPYEQSIRLVTRIEDQFGARSTFFFIPFARRAGHVSENRPTSDNRASHYGLAECTGLIRWLVGKHWEVGVHGIDSHVDAAAACSELAELRRIVGPGYRIGNRMHWLYSSPDLYQNLKRAGYYYDATLGWNDRVGFPDSHYEPFQDPETGLWVVPLNIQDVALLREDHMNLSLEDAWQKVVKLLEKAREHHAVVTLLWHNDSFLPPMCWGGLYRRILERAQTDGASMIRAVDALDLCRPEPGRRAAQTNTLGHHARRPFPTVKELATKH